MRTELELSHFIAARLQQGQRVVLLVVATSSGSSPGRPGYKMAVAEDGEMIGSIGGGVMEVNLVDRAGKLLSGSRPGGETFPTVTEQVHRKNVLNSSGMICSGKQTVIFKLLTSADTHIVLNAIKGVEDRDGSYLLLTPDSFEVKPRENSNSDDLTFVRKPDNDFEYRERLGAKSDLYIIGGGHCALALSEMMSKMDFHIYLFDDRPQLNTIEKNRFANDINVIESYDRIGEHVESNERGYIVVMTLGYITDAIVIRQLVNKDFKYFGVLGSEAKMATLFRELINEGVAQERLDRIHSPIGLPINSHSPEEIAVSIAAEIISIKNSKV